MFISRCTALRGVGHPRRACYARGNVCIHIGYAFLLTRRVSCNPPFDTIHKRYIVLAITLCARTPLLPGGKRFPLPLSLSDAYRIYSPEVTSSTVRRVDTDLISLPASRDRGGFKGNADASPRYGRIVPDEIESTLSPATILRII